MLRWQEGRSGGGYRKLTIFECRFPLCWDMHILHIPTGSHVAPHTDPVTGMSHWRLNVLLKKSKEGGEFVTESSVIDLPRIKLFRPDISKHMVTEVTKGDRVCLSIGFAFNK
jgi:hypothetical protein